MSDVRVEMIRERISTALTPRELEIVDESAKHAGHAGAAGGGGHYIVRIVSDSFRDLSLIQRHRLVYEAMGDAMQREIHALSIQAFTPGEVSGHGS